MLAARINHGRADRSDEALSILDLCSGSGCVALNLANLIAHGESIITGVDISQTAIELCRENRRRNGPLFSSWASIDFVQADLWSDRVDSLISKADVICMNPPYIPRQEEQQISLSARRYEPRLALVPGTSDDSGDIFYERVIQVLKDAQVEKSQILVFECGSHAQAIRIGTIMRRSLGCDPSIWKDSGGRTRCLFASLSGVQRDTT